MAVGQALEAPRVDTLRSDEDNNNNNNNSNNNDNNNNSNNNINDNNNNNHVWVMKGCRIGRRMGFRV